MNTALIQEEDLKNWTGYKRRSQLINWLRQHGIPYFLGQSGRVCCTAESINLPLDKKAANNNDANDAIDFQ